MIDIGESDIDELEAEHNALSDDPLKQWRFDDRRRHAIKSWDDVQACPGSGKTTLVAAKLLILAKKWKEPHKGICVLTHTNVARDEIISRLHDHPAGFKLTSYPHFIGTIQEFVNRFLALPYVRGQYEFKRFIEGDEGYLEVCRAQLSGCTIENICRNLYRVCDQADYRIIKNYLGSLHFLNGLGDLRFFKQNNSAENSPHSSNSDRRTMLRSLKEALCNSGVFQYRDMYAFAEMLINENSDQVPAIRKRFPFVIIDEMQDTQKFQETILNQLFVHESVSLQRLGDPDQAIFDGIGGDEPNDTYNNNSDLYEIKSTHRFGFDICEKIIGLSYYKLDQLSSDREPDRGDCQHSLFLYDTPNCEYVLDVFGELVARIDHDNNWNTVKAVGGVEGGGGHISKYWSKYDSRKSSSSPKPKKLIHIAQLCHDQSAGHASLSYDLLVRGIVDLLRMANVKTTSKDGKQVYFSRRSLMWWLKEKEKYHEFRKTLASIMLGDDLSVARWAAYIEKIKAIHELNALTAEANEFLEHDATLEAVDEDIVTATNVYLCADGREIEVGTIHSVKGETHDATLILETKYHQDDVKQMLPYIIDTLKAQPTADREKEFMRKLYVAGSRPRHLLCMAMHKDNINDGQIADLIAREWSVLSVLGAQKNDG